MTKDELTKLGWVLLEWRTYRSIFTKSSYGKDIYGVLTNAKFDYITRTQMIKLLSDNR